ncbi:hypothetical protein E2C01_067627 [Portunus trituberculatus]|uniref:Uncharacterized protein n=1 Tax=Portunus trituberculatus TaxID=210409 RepID=A0A5B7HT54_PORTR|nr:hypothetical protein [Portunus trituberculatus]
MFLLALANADKTKQNKLFCSRSSTCSCSQNLVIQEAMSAIELHTFSICANRQEETETAGLPTSCRPPNSSLIGGGTSKAPPQADKTWPSHTSP